MTQSNGHTIWNGPGPEHFFLHFIENLHGSRGKVSIDFWHAEGVPKIDRNLASHDGGVASNNEICNNFKKSAPKAPLRGCRGAAALFWVSEVHYTCTLSAQFSPPEITRRLH